MIRFDAAHGAIHNADVILLIEGDGLGGGAVVPHLNRTGKEGRARRGHVPSGAGRLVRRCSWWCRPDG